LEHLQKENWALLDLLKDAVTEIKHLKEQLYHHKQTEDGYDKNWTVVARIVFHRNKSR
jgi:hypothetical protein